MGPHNAVLYEAIEYLKTGSISYPPRFISRFADSVITSCNMKTLPALILSIVSSVAQAAPGFEMPTVYGTFEMPKYIIHLMNRDSPYCPKGMSETMQFVTKTEGFLGRGCWSMSPDSWIVVFLIEDELLLRRGDYIKMDERMNAYYEALPLMVGPDEPVPSWGP